MAGSCVLPQAPSAVAQDPPQACLPTVSGRPLHGAGRKKDGQAAGQWGRGRAAREGKALGQRALLGQVWREVEVTALWESLEG